MNRYTLLYSPEAKEAITNLSPANLKRIAERILLGLLENPFGGKKLLGKLSGLYSIRITRRYRAIYKFDTAKHAIWILDVSSRKDVYR